MSHGIIGAEISERTAKALPTAPAPPAFHRTARSHAGSLPCELGCVANSTCSIKSLPAYRFATDDHQPLINRVIPLEFLGTSKAPRNVLPMELGAPSTEGQHLCLASNDEAEFFGAGTSSTLNRKARCICHA